MSSWKTPTKKDPGVINLKIRITEVNLTIHNYFTKLILSLNVRNIKILYRIELGQVLILRINLSSHFLKL